MKDDSVSRQAAIETVRKAKSIGQAHRMLIQLPSAQPEIIRCKDCRHNHNCDIQYHAQAGDMFFCAGAERRTE